MRYLTLLHFSLVVILASGVGYCARDSFEGPSPRLLVKEHSAPDSKYASEVYIYLSGSKGASATVDVNTNYQWYIDEPSLYTVPNWCRVSVPSGILTGFVTDQTISFVTKGDNVKPFAQQFDLILRHSADPNVKVTIHVMQNILGEDIHVSDYEEGTIIAQYEAAKRLETQPPYPPAYISFAGTGSGLDGMETCYFVVNSPKPWKFTLRPSGVNANEYVGDWISAGLLGNNDVTAQKNGNNITFSYPQSGAVTVWFTVQANASNRYPRTAEIELLMDNDYNINATKLAIRQQTATAYLLINKDGKNIESLDFDALNPDNSANAFSQTLATFSNRNWTATIPQGAQSWLSINPAEVALDPSTGEAASNVSVTVTPNPSLTEPRSATVTFSGWYILQGKKQNDLTRSLTITQPAKTLEFSTTAVEPYEFSAGNSGLSIAKTFTITSNHPWTITGTGDTGAFTVTPSSGDQTSQNLTQTISVYPNNPNTSTSQAFFATYTIYCNEEVKASFTVTQAKFVPNLEIISGGTPGQFAGTGALAQTLKFKCNFAFTIPPIDYWLETNLKGPAGENGDEYTLTFRAEDNPDANNGRSGSLQITANNTDYSSYNKSVSVSQDKKWTLNVSVPALSFGIGSGLLYSQAPAAQSVTISGYIGGGQWTIVLNPNNNMNTFTPSSGSSSAALPAVVTVRPTSAAISSDRNWTITVSVANSTLKQDISVTQKGTF